MPTVSKAITHKKVVGKPSPGLVVAGAFLAAIVGYMLVRAQGGA